MFLTINNLKNSYYILDFWLLQKKLETKAEQGLTTPVAKVTMVAFGGLRAFQPDMAHILFHFELHVASFVAKFAYFL